MALFTYGFCLAARLIALIDITQKNAISISASFGQKVASVFIDFNCELNKPIMSGVQLFLKLCFVTIYFCKIQEAAIQGDHQCRNTRVVQSFEYRL